MRRIDDTPLDPEIAAELDAIDATLAGEPVDPAYAEIAELALLLAASRPATDPEFTRALDQRVARQFASPAGNGAAAAGAAPRRWRGSWLGPLAGLSTAAVAAVAVVVVLSLTGGGSSSPPAREFSKLPAAGAGSTGGSATAGGGASTSAASTARGSTAGGGTAGGGTSTSAASSVAPGVASGGAKRTASSAVPPGVSSGASSAANRTASVPAASLPSSAKGPAQPVASPVNGAVFAPAQSSASAPAPLPNGRQVIQSAQLALSSAPGHIELVAQELFDVVGRENGYVNNSTVTAGSDGYAQFQLSVPSSALQATMTALSQLRYATVDSRTDATQDVNGEYLSDQRQLADARALRTSLLKSLANAITQQQIDSLNAQIRDVEASIRSDESTFRKLNDQIDYSQIAVTINGAPAPVATHHSSGAFTIGKAAHDAGRVLTVAAGVALITLAALVPVLLVGALAGWIAVAVRRRRREQALDLA